MERFVHSQVGACCAPLSMMVAVERRCLEIAVGTCQHDAESVSTNGRLNEGDRLTADKNADRDDVMLDPVLMTEYNLVHPT
jgi:hypothetical protein